MASFKVETLIPQVDLPSVWHGAYSMAGAFQNPLSLGVTDIMFSWLSSHLFVLFSASLGKKIVSSVFTFLASTPQTEPVVLHAMSHFGDPQLLIPPKSIDISSALWIGLYNCLTYTYLCVPEALWCQHFLNWTHYLPFLQTSNSSYISISVNVRARRSGYPYLLTTSSSLLPAYRHLHSHKVPAQLRRHFFNLCSHKSAWPLCEFTLGHFSSRLL